MTDTSHTNKWSVNDRSIFKLTGEPCITSRQPLWLLFFTLLVICSSSSLLVACLSFFLFLLWGGTGSLHMPVLRPGSQAGPMHNPRNGSSVV